MNPNRAYGNVEIYSPDGHLMFRTNDDKLRFYKRKDLVEPMSDFQYRLKFVPKGLGHGERNQDLLEPRENKCVRCGEEDLFVLTRHHVVPTRFRKFLPKNIKGNNHRYVVFLCTDCHEEYGYFENQLNEVIAKELGIKSLKQCNDEIYIEKRIITGIADTILFKEGIPADRLAQLKKDFQERTDLEPTTENLAKVRRKKYEPTSPENNFGKLVIDNVKNIYYFQQMWLEHFVETMKPKFLPKDLLVLLTEDFIRKYLLPLQK